MSDFICPHCGLPTAPLPYHEGPADCTPGLIAEVKRLRVELAAANDAIRHIEDLYEGRVEAIK